MSKVTIDNKKYLKSLEDRKAEIVREDPSIEAGIERSINSTKRKTEANEEIAVKLIEGAIQRVFVWNDSGVTIETEIEPDNIYMTSSTFTVRLNRASFTLFADAEGFELGDILELGDVGMFSDDLEEADYFSLVQELQKPGSTSRGKDLTLYTARPTADRAKYESARSVPKGLFLSSDPDDAEGIAADFGGRDLWEIEINSKYLAMTLNRGRLKHFQVVVDNAPASMWLIAEGKGKTARIVARVVSRYLRD